jgi:membrane protein YdbS with pleckstrin-like domain
MAYSDNLVMTKSPSQWINLGFFIIGVVFFTWWLPPILALIKYLEVYYWRYDFHEQTMTERKGLFSVTRTELSYYRIKSIMIEEPVWMRLFGLSNVIIKTSDQFTPTVTLYAVRDGVKLRNYLRSLADNKRNKHGVKEFDLYSL